MITCGDGWSHLTSESPAFIAILFICASAIFIMPHIISAPTEWIRPKRRPSGFYADDVRPCSFSLGDNYAVRWSKLEFLIVLNSCPLQTSHYSFKGTQMNWGEKRGYLFIQGPAMQWGGGVGAWVGGDNCPETCKMNPLVWSRLST